MNYFDGKTILLTGANGGLGTEMVRQLAESSARLILTDIGPTSLLEQKNILRYIQADIANRSGCETLVRACEAIAPDIDILINNAGLASVGYFVDVPDDIWEKQILVNLVAPMMLTKLLLPGMIARRSGHIVNISSVGGHAGMPKTATYAATKWGLRGFGLAMMDEVAPHGIQVSNVYPTFTRTPILDSDRYGYKKTRELPSFMIDTPRTVIRATLLGVASRKPHIFPSFSAWASAAIAQFAPSLMRRILRLLVDRVD